MIFDLARNENLPAFSADVCIVGAGAAGIALAAELVRQGKRVLLLESGGVVIEPDAQLLNDCSYAGQPHQGANQGRFRGLGGTTTIWGGQVLELNAEDFAIRSWIPGSGWPFSKAELQPYYERALQAEGLSSVMRDDADVWRRMKVAAPNLGDALTAYFTHWCPEPDFSRLYRELLDSPNLLVIVHTTATGMLLTDDGSSVRGIICKNPSGKEFTFAATQYALCLGTIESVRFLLQPISSREALPWNQSGMLGRHFQSHIDFNAARVPQQDGPRLQKWFATAFLDGVKYHPKFHLNFQQQKQEKILNIGGSITCINPTEMELRKVKALARNLLQRQDWNACWNDIPAVFRQLPTLLQLAYGYTIERRAAWPRNSFFWLRAYCEQEPLSTSHITLTDQLDSAGMFRVELDWRISPLEWRTIRYFTEQVQAAFAGLGLASIQPAPELAREDGFCDLTFDDSHHHMGGARMATNAIDGVVDPNLKLHGIDNAFVCSAAVFPGSGFSNPTHTLIALAIRLADHLTGKNISEKDPLHA